MELGNADRVVVVLGHDGNFERDRRGGDPRIVDGHPSTELSQLNPQRGPDFGDAVVDTIAEYAPNLKSIIRHRQVLTPLDLEREWSLSEGNIFQGELSLEQLFFLRPVPGWARYRTPVQGLYLCGSATHPGGGIMGAPGRLAALEVLKDVGAAR